MECPVCSILNTEKNQNFCLNCAWEFEYYLEELNLHELNQYKQRLKIQKRIYFLSKKNEMSLDKSRRSKFFMGIVIVFFIFILIVVIFEISNIDRRVSLEENNTNIVNKDSAIVEENMTKQISKLALEIKNDVIFPIEENRSNFINKAEIEQKNDIVEKYSLTIHTEPSNAKIQILNIKPIYKDGILLKADKYRLKISLLGYKTVFSTISIDSNFVATVILEEIKYRNRLDKELDRAIQKELKKVQLIYEKNNNLPLWIGHATNLNNLYQSLRNPKYNINNKNLYLSQINKYIYLLHNNMNLNENSKELALLDIFLTKAYFELVEEIRKRTNKKRPTIRKFFKTITSNKLLSFFDELNKS